MPLSLWACFRGQPRQEGATGVEKAAQKADSGTRGQAPASGAVALHASRPAALSTLSTQLASTTPRITVRVYNVEHLANLHPRVLERILPHLLALSSPGSLHASCNVCSAVAHYWQVQEAQEAAGKSSLLPQHETGRSEGLLFLQPTAINTAAGALLGCATTPSECVRVLAQQLQFQGQAPCQQPITTSTHESSSSLAAVLFDIAAHTLRCSPSIPAAEPSAHSSLHIAAGNKPHTPVGHLPKQAYCGDGLVAHVHAAYCTAPGGALDPVLILEHATLEANSMAAGSPQRESWLPPPSGSSANSMEVESTESPRIVRASYVDASLHHYIPSLPHPTHGAHPALMPTATPCLGSSHSNLASSSSNAFAPARQPSLSTTRPWLIAESAHGSGQLHTGQPQAELAMGSSLGSTATESHPHNIQQPAQVQVACPPVIESSQEHLLFGEISMQKEHSRALAILNEVPVIATLFNVEGHVVYQNEASLSYWGLLVKGLNGVTLDHSPMNSGACNLSMLLEILLPNNPEAIQELLDVVGEGLLWQRVLAVRPPRARSQAQASITPAAFSQRSRRASLVSSITAGSNNKNRDGWSSAGTRDFGNSGRSTADSLGDYAAEMAQEQPHAATQKVLPRDVQKQPKQQLHRQQSQPQSQQQSLLRRAVSFASDLVFPSDAKQREREEQQDKALEGDFPPCQVSRSGDSLVNSPESPPDPETQAQGLERASTVPVLSVPSILPKNGLTHHGILGRDSLRGKADSPRHWSLSSSQRVGKDTQEFKPVSTSEDGSETRAGLPVPPTTPLQATAPRPIAIARPDNSNLSSQELDETPGPSSFSKISCPAGTPRGRSNFLMSSDGVLQPRGSPSQTEASSGPSNVVAPSRTNRSGLAVEPSSRVMSLIQGTRSAHDSKNGEGVLSRKTAHRKRIKHDFQRTRNLTISNFQALHAVAELSKHEDEESEYDPIPLSGANIASRSSPSLDPRRGQGPASVLSTLLSDDGPSSQQQTQQQQGGSHSCSQSQLDNETQGSCLLPVFPGLERDKALQDVGVLDLEGSASQSILDPSSAQPPQPSSTRSKHAYKHSRSSPLPSSDFISCFDNKAHISSESEDSSTGCSSPCAASGQGCSFTRGTTYESLDNAGNPDPGSIAASMADSYITAGDFSELLLCGAVLEPGVQRKAVPVPGGQQQLQSERQGQHHCLQQQQQQQQGQGQEQEPQPPSSFSSGKAPRCFAVLGQEQQQPQLSTSLSGNEQLQQQAQNQGPQLSSSVTPEKMQRCLAIVGQQLPQQQQQQQQPQQLQQQLLQPQLSTSLSRDEHSFCHLAEESIEDGQLERCSSTKTRTDLCWHEVLAMAITDPVSGQAALLLLQTDITSRAVLESRMAALTESQLAMLEQMFPRHVLEYMVTKQPGQQPAQAETASHLASSHENVTILFTDIVGFTSMSKEVKPDQVMGYLNELFTAFDALVDTYEIYKVETAGDCYIAAGGLTKIDQDGFICIDHEPDPVEAAHRVLSFAKALLYCAKTVMMPHNGQPTRIRVGMHTGPAVTGLIGTKLPKYSVFGDTMNTASRMESSCPYGCIQISEATHALLSDHPFKPTGGVEVKGKGRMETYIWDPEEEPTATIPPDVVNAVVRAKEAVYDEEDAMGHSSNRSLPIQGEFAERAQLHDMRSAFAEDWSDVRRRSTGPASSTLSCRGASPEWEGLQHGQQQEQALAQQARMRSTPVLQNRHPLAALHNLQGCFPTSPLPPNPMSQGPSCHLGQDPVGPRSLQQHVAAPQPGGRSLAGAKFASFNHGSKGESPSAGNPSSSDSLYSQLRQSLGDLAMGHHRPPGSSRLSGSGSPFSKSSFNRPRSQQQVELGPSLGQPALHLSSDHQLSHLLQLPPGPPQEDMQAQQATPHVQHSSCQGPLGAQSAVPATTDTLPERKLRHSWTHSVVGAPQQASPSESAQSLGTLASNAGVAPKVAVAQGPPPEPAAATSPVPSHTPSPKQPDIPTTMLQSLYQAPFAQHQHGLSTPHYLSRQLVQDPPLQSHHKPSRSATGASSGEIGTAFGQAPGKAPHAASSAPSGGREEGSSLLGIRLSQASSDVTEPGMPPPDVPMFPCAMKRRPSFVMQAHVKSPPSYLLGGLEQNAMPAMAPRPPRRQATMSAAGSIYTHAIQESSAEELPAPQPLDFANSATHPQSTPADCTFEKSTPDAQAALRRKPQRFMSQLILQISNAEASLLQSATAAAAAAAAETAAAPAGAPRLPDAPASPPQLWRPRNRRGSVIIADDAAPPGGPRSQDTPASPSQLWRPRNRWGSVTVADEAAPPGAPGSQDTLASPFRLWRPRSRRGSVTIADEAAPPGEPRSQDTPASPPSLLRRSFSRRRSVTIADAAAPPGARRSQDTPAGPSLMRRSRSRQGSVTIADEAAAPGAPEYHGDPVNPSLLQRSFTRRSVTIADEVAPPGASRTFNTPASPSLLRRSLSRRGSSVTFSDEFAGVANNPVFSSAAVCGQHLGCLGSMRSRRASALSIEEKCSTHSLSSNGSKLGAPPHLTRCTSNGSTHMGGGLDRPRTSTGGPSNGSRHSSVHHEHTRGGESAMAAEDESPPYSSVRGRVITRGSSGMMRSSSMSGQQQDEAVEAAAPSFVAGIPPSQCTPAGGVRNTSVLGQQLHSMLKSGSFAFPQNTMRGTAGPLSHEGPQPPQPLQAARGRRSAELSRSVSERQHSADSHPARRSSFKQGRQQKPAKGAQEDT